MQGGIIVGDHISPIDKSVGHKVEHQERANGDHVHDYSSSVKSAIDAVQTPT